MWAARAGGAPQSNSHYHHHSNLHLNKNRGGLYASYKYIDGLLDKSCSVSTSTSTSTSTSKLGQVSQRTYRPLQLQIAQIGREGTTNNSTKSSISSNNDNELCIADAMLFDNVMRALSYPPTHAILSREKDFPHIWGWLRLVCESLRSR